MAPDAGAVTAADGGSSLGGGPAVQFAVLHETAASNNAQPFAVNVAGPLAHSGKVSRQAGAAAPEKRAAPGAITTTDASVPARATTVADAAGRPQDSRPPDWIETVPVRPAAIGCVASAMVSCDAALSP